MKHLPHCSGCDGKSNYERGYFKMKGINFNCLLGRGNAVCSPTENCKHCGWEKSERERRTKHTREHGLTLCEDGIRRLDISKIERETCWNF